MAKTLLDGVNDVLKKVGMIAGDSGELSSLTDSARQVFIDEAVFAWNEAVEELYTKTQMPRPKVLSEATITLVEDDRDYALESDLTMLYWPLLDEDNGSRIYQYPGEYLALVNSQLNPDNYTGTPISAAIRPVDGELYLDRIPTADVAGRVYKYRYDKDVSLSAAADVFPFDDAVYRAMLPAVAELWKADKESTFQSGTFRQNMARAGKFLRQGKGVVSWRSYA